MEIPRNIQEIIGNKCENQSNIGLSNATVYLYDDMVLKIQSINDESEREINMLRWLEDKLPVPKVIEHAKANKLSYLLMSKCSGKMACNDEYMQNPKHQGELLADTLHEIWQVDWTGCPYQSTLERKLEQAEYNVTNGVVDLDNCQTDIYKEFKNPEALLYWLQNNRPDEDLAMSHGDFCLPNILFNNGTLSGLIDLGRSGVADKWCDITLCYRSIKDNFCGRYDRRWTGYSDHYFFEALHIKPDWDKIRYYILLDELF